MLAGWRVAVERLAGRHTLQALQALQAWAEGQDVNGALSTTRFCCGGAMPDWKRDETLINRNCGFICTLPYGTSHTSARCRLSARSELSVVVVVVVGSLSLLLCAPYGVLSMKYHTS